MFEQTRSDIIFESKLGLDSPGSSSSRTCHNSDWKILNTPRFGFCSRLVMKFADVNSINKHRRGFFCNRIFLYSLLLLVHQCGCCRECSATSPKTPLNWNEMFGCYERTQRKLLWLVLLFGEDSVQRTEEEPRSWAKKKNENESKLSKQIRLSQIRIFGDSQHPHNRTFFFQASCARASTSLNCRWIDRWICEVFFFSLTRVSETIDFAFEIILCLKFIDFHRGGTGKVFQCRDKLRLFCSLPLTRSCHNVSLKLTLKVRRSVESFTHGSH